MKWLPGDKAGGAYAWQPFLYDTIEIDIQLDISVRRQENQIKRFDWNDQISIKNKKIKKHETKEKPNLISLV